MKEINHFSKNLSSEEIVEIKEIIQNFDSFDGGSGERNIIKVIPLGDSILNIKAFKKPNFINQISYGFIRKSKARRSFEYANILLNKKVKTPEPIAYFEFFSGILFKNSFYVSEHLNCDLTFRELIKIPDYPNHEPILRAFTRFTFSLHEKQINFLDHSAGNTLITTKNEDYNFYLVDLNRMKFESMDFKARMKNFARLAPQGVMLEIMADEYSKLYNLKSKDEILKWMDFYYQKFVSFFSKKEQFKKKYFFWRKK